jgi:hypothetical protein
VALADRRFFILAPLADREGMLFASVGFSVLLISGVLLVAKYRMTRGLVTVTALITLIIHWIQHVVPGTGLASMSALSSIGFLALLAGLVFLEVLKKGPITLHRVQGAVAVYLLFGLIWAFAYDLVILHAPQAFHADELTVQHGPLTPTLIYFSFATPWAMAISRLSIRLRAPWRCLKHLSGNYFQRFLSRGLSRWSCSIGSRDDVWIPILFTPMPSDLSRLAAYYFHSNRNTSDRRVSQETASVVSATPPVIVPPA